MKRKLLLIVSSVFIITTAFAQGVVFHNLSLEEALEKAKAKNKNVFVDCYTSWCGPCKDMTNRIFPQEKVGTFMNERFISVKYDMEKGEGKALAEKFQVTAYPTFLVLNPEGKVLHKFVGSRETDAFLAEFDYDPKQAWGDIQARYENGDRDPLFLKDYLQRLMGVGDKSAPRVAEELFALLNNEERYSDGYRFLFTDLSHVGNSIYNFLLDNRERFNVLMGKERVDALLTSNNMDFLNFASFGETDFTNEERADIERNLQKVNIPTLYPFWNVVQACRSGDNKRIIKACRQNFPQMDLHRCGSYYSMFLAQIQKGGTKSQQKACAKILSDIKKRSAIENAKKQEMMQQRIENSL